MVICKRVNIYSLQTTILCFLSVYLVWNQLCSYFDCILHGLLSFIFSCSSVADQMNLFFENFSLDELQEGSKVLHDILEHGLPNMQKIKLAKLSPATSVWLKLVWRQRFLNCIFISSLSKGNYKQVLVTYILMYGF